jgi:hypothetical protein
MDFLHLYDLPGLALVAKQEIHSNPPTLAAHPSPNKKHLLDQVSHIHGPHAISTSPKESAVGQLSQAYFESKQNLESSFHLPNSKIEPMATSGKPNPSVAEEARLFTISLVVPPRTITTNDHAIWYPVTQPDDPTGLVWLVQIQRFLSKS